MAAARLPNHQTNVSPSTSNHTVESGPLTGHNSGSDTVLAPKKLSNINLTEVEERQQVLDRLEKLTVVRV